MIFCKKIFAILIIVTLLFAPKTLLARKSSSENSYVINDIFSSSKEVNSSVSRVVATSKANRIAFLSLLKNLGINPKHVSSVSDEQIADAVYSRRITNERIADNYYSAKFNISFQKSAINALLDDNEISEISKPNRKEVFLMFPVEIRGSEAVLWERDNSWRKSLEESVRFLNAKNILLPSGDYQDIMMVNLQNIQKNNYKDFIPILQRYNAAVAITAYLDIDRIENKANITLGINRESGFKKVKLSFVNSNNLATNDLFLEVSHRVVSHIVNNSNDGVNIGSKPKKVKFKPGQKIRLNIRVSRIENWVTAKKKLESLYFVKKVKLVSLSKDLVRVLIHTKSKAHGESMDIIELFNQNNLRLRRDHSGEYFLSAQ